MQPETAASNLFENSGSHENANRLPAHRILFPGHEGLHKDDSSHGEKTSLSDGKSRSPGRVQFQFKPYHYRIPLDSSLVPISYQF